MGSFKAASLVGISTELDMGLLDLLAKFVIVVSFVLVDVPVLSLIDHLILAPEVL